MIFFPTRPGSIESLTFAFSLFFHIICFQIIVLMFPIGPVLFKPPLIFLGPFLDQSEFSITPSPLKYPHLDKNAEGMEVTQQSRFYPQTTHTSKPLYFMNMDKRQREYLKNTFLKKETQDDNQLLKELGIDPKTAPRTPLRLDAR